MNEKQASHNFFKLWNTILECDVHNNESRFEPLERAQKIEYAIRDAWKNHSNHQIISCKEIEEKIKKVVTLISNTSF